MSAVLGHIHYWLYNKIRLVLEREKMLVEASNTAFDNIGEEFETTLNSMFGVPPAKATPLEDLIDTSNIHGWLQTLVTTCEAREATLIKDLIDCFGEDAEILIFNTFANHGLACGKQAKQKELLQRKERGEEITPAVVYALLQDYMLNGMPCDQADNILQDDARHFIWMGNHRQQRLVWARIGVPSGYMTKAYRNWIIQFLAGLEINATYKVDERVEPFTYTIKFP